MKKSFILLVAIAVSLTSQAQKYFTNSGKVSFFSKAAIENIEAHTNQAFALMNTTTGGIAYKIIIRSFEFDKALMQEHFNEEYMESVKFPNATFEGKITNLSAVDFKKDGTYKVTVKGKLTVHGVTKEVEIPGDIKVEKGKIVNQSTFKIKLADYGVINDKKTKIADEIEIKVDAILAPKS